MPMNPVSPDIVQPARRPTSEQAGLTKAKPGEPTSEGGGFRHLGGRGEHDDPSGIRITAMGELAFQVRHRASDRQRSSIMWGARLRREHARMRKKPTQIARMAVRRKMSQNHSSIPV
jgi:hypothetical protein